MRFKICGILFCLLVISAQCASPTMEPDVKLDTKLGPEVINCIVDKLPAELQMGQKRERIFFSVERSTEDRVLIHDIYAFDPGKGTIENIFLDFPIGQGEPVLSPSETYFVFRKRIRAERSSGKITIYQRPVIRVIDSQIELPVPLEITNSDVLGWSPDGKCLVIMSNQKSEMVMYHLSSGEYQRWQLPSEVRFGQTTGFVNGNLSPDGRWVAGLCGEGICVMKVNGEVVHRSSEAAGAWRWILRWSPDSKYLLIRDGEWGVSYLDVEAGWLKRPLISSANCRDNCEAYASLCVTDWSLDGAEILGGTTYPFTLKAVRIDFPSGNVHELGVDLLSLILSPDGNQVSGHKLTDSGSRPAGIYITRLDSGDLELIRALGLRERGDVLFWTSEE